MPARFRGPSRPAARRTTNRTASPDAFLSSLEPGVAAELARVRDVVRRHLPAGYEEAVSGKLIVYQVPLDRYPDAGRPLWIAALGAPKSYLTLHLMGVYASPELTKRLADGFRAAGTKLSMGKACIRFRTADDLALGTVGEIVAAVPLEKWLALARAGRRR